MSVITLLCVFLRARAASGQQERPAADAVCYGFAFGTWNPVLDWKGAGHQATIAPGTVLQAPGNRDWAVDEKGHDLMLTLFPDWWPAGVGVALDRLPSTPGDTVAGRAMALVADGRVRSPAARARAWVVPCARK